MAGLGLERWRVSQNACNQLHDDPRAHNGWLLLRCAGLGSSTTSIVLRRVQRQANREIELKLTYVEQDGIGGPPALLVDRNAHGERVDGGEGL